jgi:DNA-binding protein HU-beta
MSKKFFTDYLAESTGLNKTEVTKLLEALPKAVEAAVAAGGGRAVLHNVATFKIVAKAERMGRNPQTGAQLVIPARNVLKITAVGDLQKAIDNK